MNAVTIAAHTCAKYRLRKIVAYIQPEFAPYLLSDIFGAAEVDIRTREKLFHCKYIFAVKRRFLFAENYADSGLRVKAAAVSFMVRGDFYKRVPKEVLFSVADRNMCRMLAKAEYTEKKISCGIDINCLDFKAEGNDFTVALMMCSDFREFISSKIGSRFLAAAPSKNTLLVLSEVTNDVLERLGTAIHCRPFFGNRRITQKGQFYYEKDKAGYQEKCYTCYNVHYGDRYDT